MSYRADSKQLRLNTISLANNSPLSQSSEDSWDRIGNELIELSDIFNSKGENKFPEEQQPRFISPEEYLGLAA